MSNRFVVIVVIVLRVTLIPRQPPPDPLEDKSHRKKSYSVPSGSVPGTVELSEGPLDQQLINYAFNTALIAVVSMVGPVLAIRIVNTRRVGIILVTP